MPGCHAYTAMTEPTAPTPAVGQQVTILSGPPSEMTWDDSGAELIGVQGVLTEILSEDWLAPFVVRTTEGRTVYASKIRATDEGDYEDGGMTAADFFGDGVYQPETDPVKIAAAEESLAALRDRLNRAAW